MSISQPMQPQEHGATAHGTDRAAGDTARPFLDPELAWGHHLLVVGVDTDPDDVEALALSRFAGASRRDEDTIDLLPGAWPKWSSSSSPSRDGWVARCAPVGQVRYSCPTRRHTWT